MPVTKLHIFAGFVDLHVHGREDSTAKQNYKEDYQTLGEAAINGGVVALASMPNLPLPPTTLKLYREIEELTLKSRVTVIPYAAIAPGSRPFGKYPYKGFLAESVNDLKFTSEKEAAKTLQHYRGKHVSLHCDDNEILKESAGESTHERRRPASSEVRAVRFAINQARENRFNLKVVHCSTKEGLGLIVRAKRNRNVNIVVEATPHHISTNISFLNDANRRWWQMNPPIRDRADQEAILKGLELGDIDFFATDHAPHTKEEKEKGMSGQPHLDTFGSISDLINRPRKDLTRQSLLGWLPIILVVGLISSCLGKLRGLGRLLQDLLGR